MSLYYDAESMLSDTSRSGSLKSRIYGTNSGRSKPAQLFALISETAKYDTFLKEVIDNSELLVHESKLNPLLSLFLLHDHFFSRGGISAAVAHPLRHAVERHKARLQAEFTKARIRRRCASVEKLKEELSAGKNEEQPYRIRWARFNTLKCITESDPGSLLTGFWRLELAEDLRNKTKGKAFFKDRHIPDLIGVGMNDDLTTLPAYKDGKLILQDKASCFPAYLLLGSQKGSDVGDVIDGCAAPGNKTTHLAALMGKNMMSGSIFACERDAIRSKTLEMMVRKAGVGEIVRILPKQDFLALQPHDSRFGRVTHLLLDPSCSGSGIIGREDVPKLALPVNPYAKKNTVNNRPESTKSKKRKRESEKISSTVREFEVEPNMMEEEQPLAVDKERLAKLASLQARIVEHAMAFPSARRITYSTCSIHSEENEQVVARVLSSTVAVERRWRVLRRDEQVEGMRKWKHRGEMLDQANTSSETILSAEELEGCIRCYPRDDEGTMGFFVCGFIRDERFETHQPTLQTETGSYGAKSDSKVIEEDEWSGFSDN